MSKELDDALRFDSLSEAEKITGNEYKEHEPTVWLGMALMQDNSKKKRALLEQNNDTHMESTLVDYLRVVNDVGFEQVNKIDFIDKDKDYAEQLGEHQESQYWFWHPEHSILLVFETWSKWEQPKINGGNFFYNHKPSITDWKDFPWNIYSSHSQKQDKDGGWIVCGHHDAREALRHHIDALLANGVFLKAWTDHSNLLCFEHYGEYERDEKYDADWSHRYDERKKTVLRERLGHRPDIIAAMGVTVS